MNAWEVLAIARNGEFVCWDCITKEERACANDKLELDDVSPLFASNVEQEETCGRCGEVIDGTEQDEDVATAAEDDEEQE